MSLTADERKRTSAELRANLRLSELTVDAVAAQRRHEGQPNDDVQCEQGPRTEDDGHYFTREEDQ